MNKIIKTESVAEFIARGGAVKQLAARGPKKTYSRVVKDAALAEPVDYSALPIALKIKYGVR